MYFSIFSNVKASRNNSGVHFDVLFLCTALGIPRVNCETSPQIECFHRSKGLRSSMAFSLWKNVTVPQPTISFLGVGVRVAATNVTPIDPSVK
jgi:hypothetical protein